MKLQNVIRKVSGVLFALILVWAGKRILDATGLYDKMCDYFLHPPVKGTLVDFANKFYATWEIVLFAIIFVIGYLITAVVFKLLSGKQPKAENKSERISRKNTEQHKKQLQKSNSRTYQDVLFRYEVGFDKNNIIFIEELTPYCMRHNNTPVKMIDNYHKEKYVCSFEGCSNSIDNARLNLDNPMIRYNNIIVSELEKEWEELNK
jgi:hypothetical protein